VASIVHRKERLYQEAGGVEAAAMGFSASKALREDRRLLRLLSLKHLGEIEDSGRGHGVVNVLEGDAH
jgi:hypothetical protein